jgi:hypothetical protein
VDHEPELLDSRPNGDGQPWRPPRWLLVVVALVVGAGVTGVAGALVDRAARAHESAALAQCQRELADAVVSADLEMMSVAGDIRPRLADATGARRSRLQAVLAWPARQLVPDAVRADRLCRAVSIAPWHRSLRSRRAAVTAYSSALLARLRQMAADGGSYYRDDSDLRRLRRAADLRVIGGRY